MADAYITEGEWTATRAAAEERGERSGLLRAARQIATWPDSVPRDEVIALLNGSVLTRRGDDPSDMVGICGALSPDGLYGAPEGTWVCTDVVRHDGYNHRHIIGRMVDAVWPQYSEGRAPGERRTA